MDIIICDDEKAFLQSCRKRLESIAASIGDDVNVVTYQSGENMLFNSSDWLTNTTVAYLDIDLLSMNGIHLAEEIRLLGYKGEIIYLTNSRTHVFDVFETQPFQYMLKEQLASEKFRETFIKVREKVRTTALQYLVIQTSKKNIRLYLNDIAYFEIKRRIVHANGHQSVQDPVQFYLTMDELESKLSGTQFVRTHRSFIVNMKTIQSVSADEIILQNQAHVPISRKYKNNFRENYGNFLERQCIDVY